MRCFPLAAVLALAWPASSAAVEPALGAIEKAQAAQDASRAYKVSWQSTALNPGRLSTTTLVFAPPDRYHLFDHDAVPPLEIIRIGETTWMKSGTGPWSASLDMDSIAHFHGPLRIDEWAHELREARSLGPREVKGARTQAYQYVLAAGSEIETVRVFVSETTGLPVRYERDEAKGSASWDIQYEPGLGVMPPPGQAVPGGTGLPRIPNFPRITLAASRGAFPLSKEVTQLPVVIARGDGSLRIGTAEVKDAPGIASALRSLLVTGGRTRDEFLLYAGQDVPYSLIETLLDAAREIGATRVSLGVRSDHGELVFRAGIRGAKTPGPQGGMWLIARSISGHGQKQVLSLNRADAPFDVFESRLREVMHVRSDKRVDVLVDTPRSFQDVVWLIGAITSASGEPVLQTTAASRLFAPPPPPPPPPPPRRH